jgi:hypothetical protein
MVSDSIYKLMTILSWRIEILHRTIYELNNLHIMGHKPVEPRHFLLKVPVPNQDSDRSWIYLYQTRTVIAHGYMCNKPGQLNISMSDHCLGLLQLYPWAIMSWFVTNISMSDHCLGLLQIYPWAITVLVCYKYIHERLLSWFDTNISMNDHCPGLLQIYPWTTTVLVCYKYIHERSLSNEYICSKPGQWSLMDIFVTNQDSDRSWIYL